jgi:hypothetical protein
MPPVWFFTGRDGRVLRKNRASCNANKILHAFLRGGKKRKSEAVASLLTRAGEGREEGRGGDRLEVEYFDEVGLREFLHTRADITDGMLQRFAPRNSPPLLYSTSLATGSSTALTSTARCSTAHGPPAYGCATRGSTSCVWTIASAASLLDVSRELARVRARACVFVSVCVCVCECVCVCL